MSLKELVIALRNKAEMRNYQWWHSSEQKHDKTYDDSNEQLEGFAVTAIEILKSALIDITHNSDTAQKRAEEALAAVQSVKPSAGTSSQERLADALVGKIATTDIDDEW